MRQIALEVYNQNSTTNRFIVSPIAFHVHNGIDSALIAAESLDYTNFAIWGSVTLSGGTGTITNVNIMTSSTIIATSQTSHSAGAYMAAICATGVATITGQGTDVVNYIIIF